MKIVPFEQDFGELIASWVQSDSDLRLLAPGTVPPLTAEKIIGWKKPGGAAYLALEGRLSRPVGYGELNPMRLETRHFWIGHVIVEPLLRNCGIGRQFVRLLLSEAFDRRKAEKVSLVVFPENVSAIHCYESCGFERVGDELHRFASGGRKERLLRFEATAVTFANDHANCGTATRR